MHSFVLFDYVVEGAVVLRCTQMRGLPIPQRGCFGLVQLPSQHRHRVVAPTGCGFPPLPGSLVRSPTPHYCSSYALWTCHRVRVVRLALQGAGLHVPYGLGQAGDRGEPYFLKLSFGSTVVVSFR